MRGNSLPVMVDNDLVAVDEHRNLLAHKVVWNGVMDASNDDGAVLVHMI